MSKFQRDCLMILSLAAVSFGCQRQHSRISQSDWHQWRGPTGTGVSFETDLPIEWGPDKNVRWKVALPGESNASPIVSGGLVFLLTAEQDRKKTTISMIAFDEKSGEMRWQSDLASLKSARFRNSLSAQVGTTAVSDGQMVYAYLGKDLVAVDFSGKIAWKKEIDPAYLEEVRYGAAASPVLVGDTLIVFRDKEWPSTEIVGLGWIAGFDKKTGEERWREVIKDSCCSYVTPLVIERGASTELIVVLARKIVSLDPATGKRFWEDPQEMNQPVAGAVIDGDVLCVASGAHNVHEIVCRRLTGSQGATRVEVLWRTRRSVPETSSPILYQGRFYALTQLGVLTCYDSETGQRIWRKRLKGRIYLSSLVAGDGKIYAQALSGGLTVFEAGDTYRELGENSLGERGSLATPAIANGHLLIRTAKHLFSIGPPSNSLSGFVNLQLLMERSAH